MRRLPGRAALLSLLRVSLTAILYKHPFYSPQSASPFQYLRSVLPVRLVKPGLPSFPNQGPSQPSQPSQLGWIGILVSLPALLRLLVLATLVLVFILRSSLTVVSLSTAYLVLSTGGIFPQI